MAELTTEQFNQQEVTDPTLPQGGALQPVNQVPKEIELIEGTKVDPNAQQVTTAPATADQTTVTDPNLAKATTIAPQTPTIDAQQGQVSAPAQVKAAQGTASDAFQDSLKDAQETLAANAEVDERSLVRFQYSQLMDFGPDEVPAWAKGAISLAEQTLAARGLGSSSIAGEGITAALMQAALPIAQQDAKVFQTMQLSVLDKRMQIAFLKAGHLANLDLANLNNRQQAAVINAQSFLAMDLTNLDNRQQAAIFNAQSRMQTLMSDQAALNAASQFNAQSQNQIDQFYANLTASIDTFNASQLRANSEFNASMIDLREQFNVKNALLIEQSNAQYLRDVNTANTALANEANFVNSQNLLDISNTAMANSIQLLRDREAFAFTMTENEKDRILARFLEQLKVNANFTLADMEQDFLEGTSIGKFGTDLLGSVLDNWDQIFN